MCLGECEGEAKRRAKKSLERIESGGKNQREQAERK